jgi:hypothetical protein
MTGRSTPHRFATRRGARGPGSPSTVTGHGREWRPARFRLRDTPAERDATAADWRRASGGSRLRGFRDSESGMLAQFPRPRPPRCRSISWHPLSLRSTTRRPAS